MVTRRHHLPPHDLVTHSCSAAHAEQNQSDHMTKEPYPPAEYWKERLTLAEAEDRRTAMSIEYGAPVSPEWQVRWDTFTSKLQPNDELWYFEYFPQPMTGGAGYCIVRDGVSVAWIATMRS